MTDELPPFRDREEDEEELNNLEEKFYVKGLSRREFIKMCELLNYLNQAERIHYFIAAIQLDKEPF